MNSERNDRAHLYPTKRPFALLVLSVFLCGLIAPQPCPASVQFTHDGERYELVAAEASANDILAAVEDALQIPVERLPEDGTLLTVHTKSSDLEKVISSFCESYVVLYAETADGRSVPTAIKVTVSVDTVRLDAEYRSETIRQNQLEQRMSVPLERPVEYAGIGAYIQPADDGSGIWLRPISAQSPAARCGIQLGDKVLNINGTPIQNFPDQAAMVEAIRGPVGSPVQMLIQKPDGSLINQVIMRETISSP